MKAHIVYNQDGDAITLVEAKDDAGFYTWLHVACSDLELSQPIEIETHDDFMADLVEQRMLSD